MVPYGSAPSFSPHYSGRPHRNWDSRPTLSADDREIGGLGLFMVKKFMDFAAYEYHDGLNILTLKKQID